MIPEHALRVEVNSYGTYDFSVIVDIGRVMLGWPPKYYNVVRKDEGQKEVYWLWP